MNEHLKPICVERILVSLDNSTHSFAALKAAADMARHYDAELQGVFIEDITVLNLADMPFHHEVGVYTARIREISRDGIHRAVTIQSKWVLQTFRKFINQQDIQGEFAVLRGDVPKIIQKEAEKCDLLILGKAGTNPLRSRRLGSTAKAIIRNRKGPLLLVEEDNSLGYPLIVMYTDSPLGRTSIETGRDLLDPGETLITMVSEDDPDQFKTDSKFLSSWASKNHINISIQTFKTQRFSRTVQMLRGLKQGLFILPQFEKTTRRNLMLAFLEQITLPILLVRDPTQPKTPSKNSA